MPQIYTRTVENVYIDADVVVGPADVFVLYAPDLHRKRALWNESTINYLSVCRVTRVLDLTRQQKGKPKIGRMEAHHTSNPWISLEVKRSNVKVTGLQSVKA